ncbi:MAG TPA: phospholipase [Bacillota bacterium]|nr:phospholipase [Bacillota bacterium]
MANLLGPKAAGSLLVGHVDGHGGDLVDHGRAPSRCGSLAPEGTILPDLALTHQTAAARSGEAPHPCLLLLHGRGADEQDLLGLAGLLDPRLFCVSVRAPLRAPGMPGYQWHTSLATGSPEPVSMLQSLEKLRRVVAALPGAYPVDPGRLFVLGFSQGAAMTLALSSAEPQAVSGALVLSGFWPPAAKAEGLNGKAVFVAHGSMDPVLPLTFGRAIRDALTAGGADLTYREYPMAHQISDTELGDLTAWLAERL